MSELRDFVADLMEHQGAAVDTVEPDGLEVIAPNAVRAAFGWPELARLGFGAQLPPAAQRVGLEGDWLERFETVLGGHGRRAERQIEIPHAAVLADPERVLRQALDLPNAVCRLQGRQTLWTRLALIAFRTTAVSDEKRENILWMGFNTGTGATLGEALTRLYASVDTVGSWRAPDPAVREAAGPGWDAATLGSRVRPALDGAVEAELAPFLSAMRRRLGGGPRETARLSRRSAARIDAASARAGRRGRRQGRERPAT